MILNQKDKENENLPLMSSSICFVDLAGSERLMKGGAGNDTLKNKENIIINSNLTALGKVFFISKINKYYYFLVFIINCTNSYKKYSI